MKKVTAIIVAAGKGKRMGSEISKQFLLLKGKAILAHTVEQFEKAPCIHEIVLVVGEESIKETERMVSFYEWKKVSAVVQGGAARQDSVQCGMDAVGADTDIVMIHDGVRPFVTEDMLERAAKTAAETGACILGVPAKDTIKVCDGAGKVVETPPRKSLWQIQTPQAFSKGLLAKAYEKAAAEGFQGTDDASVVEFYGAAVQVMMGSYENIKITTKEDLLLGACFLEEGKV